jgi:hypothetical protein
MKLPIQATAVARWGSGQLPRRAFTGGVRLLEHPHSELQVASDCHSFLASPCSSPKYWCQCKDRGSATGKYDCCASGKSCSLVGGVCTCSP